MSSKQTQINKFTDGINTDLHPLTAPDNLLSDCVNGTVITYNGNEYILQNDMGNFKLKNAQLPTNHIPIGIKEYGGIIYIVSHNPVENITEVGCYPSPKTISEADQSPINGGDYGLITLESVFTEYTSLIGRSTLNLYSAQEDFLLNPGDKYYIHYDVDNIKDYQTLEFYILGEDKVSYKLNDREVHYSKTPFDGDDENLNAVSWEIPGWLAYKYRVAYIDNFNLFITNIQAPPFITGTMPVEVPFYIKGQILTSDILYDNSTLRNKLHLWVTSGTFDGKGNKVYTHTQFNSLVDAVENAGEGVLDEENTTSPIEEFPSLTIITENHQAVKGNLISIESIDYTGVNKFLYTKKISSSKLECLKLETTANQKQFFIEAIPIIVDADRVNGEKRHIIYDNCIQTTTINLDTLNTADSLDAMSYYKYTVDDEEVVLNFDVVSKSSVMNGVSATINLYSPQKGENTENIEIGFPIKSISLTSISYVGQNMVIIPFDNNFEKEEVYLLELIINWGRGTAEETKTWYRTLVASEAMNVFYAERDDFSLIPLADIVKSAETFIGTSKPKLTYLTNRCELYTNNADDPKFTFDINNPASFPITTAYGSVISENNWPACGITSIDTYGVEVEKSNLFNNKGIWKNALNEESIQLVTSEGDTIEVDASHKTAEISFKGFSQIPIEVKDEVLYEYKRKYMYDFTWLFNSNTRKTKKIDYTVPSHIPTWYKIKYWIYPIQEKRGADKVFRPTTRCEQYLGNEEATIIDNWDTYTLNAAEAIKGFPLDTDEQFIRTTYGKEVTSSQSATYREDWALSSSLGECMQISSIEIPWRTVDKNVGNLQFIDGPFITNFSTSINQTFDYNGGPSMYLGWAWLYLEGVGEYLWRSDDKRILGDEVRNVHILEEKSIRKHYPYTYYGDNPHYTLWPDWYEAKELDRAPSPDPLLIQPYGTGLRDGAYAEAEHDNWTHVRKTVGMGEFLPMYSGSAMYSDANDSNPEFPIISTVSPAPTWIRTLWGLRMPVKINGIMRWAYLPLKEAAQDPSVALWVDSTDKYLTKWDTDIAPTKNTVVPRADLQSNKLNEYIASMDAYNAGEGLDKVTIPCWNNDGQSFHYLNEVLSRAAVLATHLYTVEGEGEATPTGVLLPKEIIHKEITSVDISSSRFNYNITFDRINPWQYTAESKITKGGIPIEELNTYNIQSFDPIKATFEIDNKMHFTSNSNDWAVSINDVSYDYKALSDRVVDASKKLESNYRLCLETGAKERHETVVYHDIDECVWEYAEDKTKLLSYFDYIVNNKAFVFSNQDNTFLINNEASLNNVGMTLDIKGEATWMFGKYNIDYPKAYINSRLTVGALCPKLGLPPKPRKISLSPYFIQNND